MEPVAGDGLLFLVEPEKLTALKATDGSIAWQLPFTEKLAVRPVWDNGWLVLATEPGEILALRATDGHLVWRRDLESRAHALPALAADRVYIPTTDNRIVALRIDTGEPVWDTAARRIAERHPRARRAALRRRERQLLLLPDGEGRPRRLAVADGRRRDRRADLGRATVCTSSRWTTCCARST